MDRREFLKGMTVASLAPTAGMGAEAEKGRSSVATVYVLTMCHLDIGFTDTERDVLLTYFDEYIPRAIRLAETLRRSPGEERYVWTLASWMIYQYLEQASSKDRKRMENALASGDIAWHAMPFTWQTEMLDRSLIAAVLKLSASLDRRFGKKTIAGKLTDVPGHTRGLIAPCAEAGIEFLDIGVNSGCQSPAVPFLKGTKPAISNSAIRETSSDSPFEEHAHLFNWRNPKGEQIMVLYHPLGYGSTVAIPGTDIAVSVRVAIDNSGPHSPEQIKTYYAELHRYFPDAKIVATDLSAIAAALQDTRPRLPVVTQEIGDTWIYGPASDPGKVARYRELCRLRREWLSQKKLGLGEGTDLAFASRLILMPEHNWGLSTGKYLPNHRIYSPAQLREARIINPEFQKMDDEWTAKRRNIEIAVATLPAALRKEATERLRALTPIPPDRQDLKKLTSGQELQTANFVLALDAAHGAIVKLKDKRTGREWATSKHPLALFRYQTFTSADFDRFHTQYNTKKFADNDFGKPGMEKFPVESRTWEPVLQECGFEEEAGGYRIVADLKMPEVQPPLDKLVSWPKRLMLKIRLPHRERAIDLTLQCFDKRPNRLAEAMWLSFSPDAPDPNGWLLEKVGQPISPLDVMVDGNRHLHAVTRDVAYRDRNGSFTLETLDAPLVAPGQRSLLNFNNNQPDMREGVHVNLYNNLWGTAFPQWYGQDMRFRFAMKL
ncbi:MAG: DUF5054 domain-containing protein [Bryobacteraceae bacterium]